MDEYKWNLQVAQLSHRDRAARWVSFGQRWKTGTGRQYFAGIMGLIWTWGMNVAIKATNDRAWCRAASSCSASQLPHFLVLHEVRADSTSCQDAFQIDSTCYKIHKEPVRWFTAVNRCLSYNASLAVFGDDVQRYFPSSLLSVQHNAWIGLIKSWWTWTGLVNSCLSPLL